MPIAFIALLNFLLTSASAAPRLNRHVAHTHTLTLAYTLAHTLALTHVRQSQLACSLRVRAPHPLGGNVTDCN